MLRKEEVALNSYIQVFFLKPRFLDCPSTLFRQLTQYVLHHVQLDPYLYLVKKL